MPDLYTPPSNTSVGQQSQQLADAFSAIQGKAVGPASGAYNTMALNQPAWNQSAQQSLTTSSGIPQLNTDYSNLAQIFPIWQAHQDLASNNYTAGNTNPYANPTLMASSPAGGAPNPYLASPDAIVASTTPPPNTIFSTPSAAISSMGTPISGAENLMNLVQGLIGTEQGNVNVGMTNASQAYQAKMGVLGNLISALGTQATNAQNAVNIPGTKQQAGATFDDIINQVQAAKGGQATENDVWNYINEHDSALRAQGVNVDELWRLHHDLASKVGTGGIISGGKTATSFQSKKIGTGENAMVVNFNPKTGKYYDPNTGKPFQISDPTMKSAENVITNIDQIYTSWNSLSDFEKHIPDSLITAIPALSPARAALNTKFYYGLEGDLRKLIIGGRITQQEIAWIKNAIIPTYADSDASAKAKVDAVKQAIANKLSNPNIDLTQTKLPGGGKTTGGKSDPLGIL